jgi:two-component system, sensor histidine kinase and response regulator
MMSKLVIICVDDEPTILDSLEIELKKTVGDDYFIEMAENGEEALEVCEDLLENGHEIALVISDCIMPGMKGDELLKRIHAFSPKTVKIMLTGQANLEEVANAIKSAKLYRYIAKPWQSDDFRLTVTEALHSYLQTKKLEEFYANLEEKIAQRTHELQDKNGALIKLNQDKNEFLGIAAHDLKNPLSAIQGLAEMIITDYDEMPKSEVIDASSMILNSARQMFNLVKSLLDVNAIESGKLNISPRQVNLLPTVQKVVDCCTKQANEKNISLQLQYQEKQYDAFVDKNTVYEVFDNLISNAVKYSPHGKKIYVRLLQHERIVRCEVEDEGPGLSKADQQKLFGKFARLTPRPTGKESSTGLGLFIVKKLVQTMNGKVWCQSQLGQGATFIVEFPVVNSQ